LRVLLESAFFRNAEDIGHDGFFVKVLASLAVGTVAGLMVLLARLGLVLDVGQDLGLELVSAMGETALVTESACTLQLEGLAQLGLVLPLVVLNEQSSLFGVSELLSLGLDINQEGLGLRI